MAETTHLTEEQMLSLLDALNRLDGIDSATINIARSRWANGIEYSIGLSGTSWKGSLIQAVLNLFAEYGLESQWSATSHRSDMSGDYLRLNCAVHRMTQPQKGEGRGVLMASELEPVCICADGGVGSMDPEDCPVHGAKAGGQPMNPTPQQSEWQDSDGQRWPTREPGDGTVELVDAAYLNKLEALLRDVREGLDFIVNLLGPSVPEGLPHGAAIEWSEALTAAEQTLSRIDSQEPRT